MTTATDIDVETFNELIESLDIKPKCEGDGCDNDAQIIIFCPVCKIAEQKHNGEFSCLDCYTTLIMNNAVIIFNKLCNHAVPLSVCETSPI